MAIEIINIGTSQNKGDGDPLRTAFEKVNANFAELAAGVSGVTDIQGSVFADNSTLLVDAVNASIPGYVSIASLKTIVAASTDFADFQSRIAAL